MPNERAIVAQGAWSPPMLGDLAAWYDASAAGAVLQDGAAQFTAACKHYLSIADNASLSATTVLEIGCWVYLDSTGTLLPILVKGTSLTGASTLEYGLYYSGSSFWFAVSNGSVVTSIRDNVTTPDSATWYFIRAGKAADGTLFISTNNATPITSSGCPDIIDSTKTFYMGTYGAPEYKYYNGRLDSVYFTKRISTAAEATALYNAGAGRTYADLTAANGLGTFASNLVSWWDLDEASGTRYDSKGTNHLAETFDDIISPTLLNGGFETLGAGGADVFGSWGELITGACGLSNGASSPYAGAYAAAASLVGGDYVQLYKNSLVVGAKYTSAYMAKTDGSSPATSVQMRSPAVALTHVLTTSYVQYTDSAWVASTVAFILRCYGAGRIAYIDNVTLRSAEIPRAAGIAQKSCSDTDDIAKLLDQSGYARHLTQTDMKKRLQYRTNQQNGLPAIVGVGGDDSLSSALDLIGTGAVTVFAAFKAAGWGGSNTGRLADNRNSVFRVSSLPAVGCVSDGGSTFAVSGPIALTTPYVACITRTATGVANFWVLGAQSGSADQSSGTPAAGSPTYIANNAEGTRGFYGDLYELGIYTRILTTPEIAALTSYLRAKWGI